MIVGANLPAPAVPEASSPIPPAPAAARVTSLDPAARLREALRARLGDDIYRSWFHTLEVESFDGRTVTVSVPVKFLRTWIKSHYHDDLLGCCRAEFKSAQHVEVVVRQRPSREELHAKFREELKPILDGLA